jgi:tetratricopeptide (TPR) repeat protein
MGAAMDEKTKELLRLGREAYQKREYAQAELYLSQLLGKHQGFADVHNMLGVIYHDRSLFTKAQEDFEQALSINPYYTEAALNLAVTYNDLGRYEDAKRIYSQAVSRSKSEPGQLDPYVKGKTANMYADIGDVFASAGILAKAVVEYNRALSLMPGFVDIRLKLAQVLRDDGKHEDAIVEFERILSENSAYLTARIHLGITYYMMGRNSEAVKRWKEVLARDPDNRSCTMYLNLVEGAGGA